jgi:O-antigen/teichoic acid export membrane protein
LAGAVFALLALEGFKPALQGLKPCRSTIGEFLRETPLLLTSGVAYALMTNSQIAIANMVLGPAAAVLLSTTRRLADLIKAVLDMASYSTEGGLAHLFGTGDKAKTVRVLREIDERFFLLSFAMLAGYVVANGSFVALWTHGQFQPIPLLTIFLAVRAFTITWGYMGVARLRASGAFRLSSTIILGDCCFRILAMFVAASHWGLMGLAIASALPSIGFGIYARARLEAVWGALPKFNVRLAATSAVIAVLAIVASLYLPVTGWVWVVSLGIAAVAASATALFLASRRTESKEPVPLGRAA